jgi:hypothetical protein
MSLFMEERPEKKLAITSFATHSTRGLIRDQKTRRQTMFVLLLVALLLLFAGSTFLQTFLSPREHPGWFMLFWFVCIWLTFTAFLLAIFDILLIRAQTRKVAKILQTQLPTNPSSPAPQKDE